jgi:hypothetical protein
MTFLRTLYLRWSISRGIALQKRLRLSGYARPHKVTRR